MTCISRASPAFRCDHLEELKAQAMEQLQAQLMEELKAQVKHTSMRPCAQLK